MNKDTSVSKIEKVKELAYKYPYRIMSVNSLHFHITGVEFMLRRHEAMMEVSKSTVRRALESLVRDDNWYDFYEVGHCFDEKLYRKSGE